MGCWMQLLDNLIIMTISNQKSKYYYNLNLARIDNRISHDAIAHRVAYKSGGLDSESEGFPGKPPE